MKLPTRVLDKTFWKFILVGVVNTLFGTAIMFIAYNVLHFSYWISTAANYVFGSILSYFLNKRFTFHSTDTSVKTVFKFILNIAVCYAVAYGVARPLTRWVLGGLAKTLQENIAMLVGMGIFVLLNYCGQRFAVFTNPSTDN